MKSEQMAAASVPAHGTTSRQYVSPTLGPTNPWAQQTSTGVFRPPSLSHALGHHEAVNRLETHVNSTVMVPFHQNLAHGEPMSSEEITRIIISAVSQERDAFATQKESNKVLEHELRQVQMSREKALSELRETEHHLRCIEAFHKEQQEFLKELK